MSLLSERYFYRALLAGLLLCLVLYAEEAVHFMRYGWNSPDNDTWGRDVSDCRPVPGRSMDIECPVRGYGLTRYRYLDHKDPAHNDIFPVDRIQ